MFGILRRAVLLVLISIAALAGASVRAEERIGVLMLHGKSPGSAQDPHFGVLKFRLEREGMVVLLPDMPWSRNRYIDGNWDQAMGEIANHIKALREKGATRIVLVGHSMGVPAALSFAARKGDVQALVLLAPGHIPLGYYTYPTLRAVHDSIDAARALVAAGKGDATDRFTDINQGTAQQVVMTPRNYLSYFDPESDAEMSVTAARVPAETPVMVVVGDKDPQFGRVKAYFVDKLPANPQNRYLEIRATHLTTPRESQDAVVEWIKGVAGGK